MENLNEKSKQFINENLVELEILAKKILTENILNNPDKALEDDWQTVNWQVGVPIQLESDSAADLNIWLDENGKALIDVYPVKMQGKFVTTETSELVRLAQYDLNTGKFDEISLNWTE